MNAPTHVNPEILGVLKTNLIKLNEHEFIVNFVRYTTDVCRRSFKFKLISPHRVRFICLLQPCPNFFCPGHNYNTNNVIYVPLNDYNWRNRVQRVSVAGFWIFRFFPFTDEHNRKIHIIIIDFNSIIIWNKLMCRLLYSVHVLGTWLGGIRLFTSCYTN